MVLRPRKRPAPPFPSSVPRRLWGSQGTMPSPPAACPASLRPPERLRLQGTSFLAWRSQGVWIHREVQGQVAAVTTRTHRWPATPPPHRGPSGRTFPEPEQGLAPPGPGLQGARLLGRLVFKEPLGGRGGLALEDRASFMEGQTRRRTDSTIPGAKTLRGVREGRPGLGPWGPGGGPGGQSWVQGDGVASYHRRPRGTVRLRARSCAEGGSQLQDRSCPRRTLTDGACVPLQPEALGSQHDDRQATQAGVVAETELQVPELGGRLQGPEGGHPVTQEVLGGPRYLLLVQGHPVTQQVLEGPCYLPLVLGHPVTQQVLRGPHYLPPWSEQSGTCTPFSLLNPRHFILGETEVWSVEGAEITQ